MVLGNSLTTTNYNTRNKKTICSPITPAYIFCSVWSCSISDLHNCHRKKVRDRQRKWEIKKGAYLKYPVNFILDGVIVDAGLGDFPHEVVDGANDISHLLTRDESVAVDIIQRESPAQLLVQRPPGQDRQSLNEILAGKIERSVRVTHFAKKSYTSYDQGWTGVHISIEQSI